MKKLSKGFTLVELIVVMALMGIVMAGAMALLSPTSRIANRIKSQNDEESIAIYVARYMSRELTYATKVEIVGADATDPVPSASSDFTAVYVVDNSTTRASSVRGCKGEVIRGRWTGSAIADQFVVGQEVLYGEEDFDIGLSEYSDASGQAFMTLDFAAFSMKVENGGFVRDTDKTYRYKESVEFLNINSQAGNMPKPVNADQFTISIDPNVSTKTDKLYIFFCPAIDTVFASSAYSSSTYSSAPSSTTLTPSSTSITPTATTSTPTPTPSTYTVVFMNNSNSYPQHNVPEGADLASYIPPESAHYPVTADADKYFSDGWYYGPNGTGGVIGSASDAHATMGTITVYKNWKKGVEVNYKDFNGNVYETCYVAQGGTAGSPSVEPTPADSKYVFDKFVKEGTTEELGQPLSGTSVTYVPTSREKPADTADIVIHYVVPFSGSMKVDSQGNEFVWNGSKSNGLNGAWYGNQYRSKGQFETFAELKENSYVELTSSDNTKNKVTVKTSDYGKTLNYYYYYDQYGNITFSNTDPSITPVTIPIEFVDSPSSMIMSPGGSGGHTYFEESGGGQYDISGDYTMWQGSCTGTKTITIYSGTKIKVADNYATYNASVIGSTGKLYVYKNIWGDFEISTLKPDTITTFTIKFLDAPTDNKIIANTTGDILTPSNNNLYSSSSDQPFFENECNKGSNHTFKFNAATTFTVDGLKYDMPNYSGSYQVWFYKKWYNNKDDAEAAYKADNGSSVPVVKIESYKVAGGPWGNEGQAYFKFKNESAESISSGTITLKMSASIDTLGNKWGSASDNGIFGTPTISGDTISFPIVKEIAPGASYDFYIQFKTTNGFSIISVE